MTIRKLDFFFRTQLIIDQPPFFNTVTDLALAPLQHLIGRNQFDSLNGRVSTISEPISFEGATLRKVVVVVCAFFLALVLTPIGIVTRYISFWSPQIDRAYCYAYLLQLSPSERTNNKMESAFAFIQKMTVAERHVLLADLPEDLRLSFFSLPVHRDSTHAFLSQRSSEERTEILKKLLASVQGPFLSLDAQAEFAKGYLQQVTDSEYSELKLHLSPQLIELYQDQKVEKEKKRSLDKHLAIAIQSLEKLEALKSKGAQEVAKIRNDIFYPFPFYLAQQIEPHPKIVARADNDLWNRFMALRQSCLTFLPPDCDDALLKTTRAQANGTLNATFNPNFQFFKDLKPLLESKMENSEVQAWIEGQKLTNYSYPFYTQPHILELKGQTVPAAELFNDCSKLLKERGLEKYLSEEPDLQHATVDALMQALDQLENIAKLEDLIKNQTA